MASETVDPIDWSQTPPPWAAPPELRVLQGVNAAYKWQDVVHQPGIVVHGTWSTGMPDRGPRGPRETWSMGMPDRRTTDAY